jgi:hypothetical protein
VSLRYGLHVEESIRSLLGGVGYQRSLAEDNATLGGSLLLLVDSVDQIPWQGGRAYETGERLTANLNLTGSQILSPTTLVDGAYGFTAQLGQLATSYNSVPIGTGMRAGEIFDGPRLRHALRGRLAQHVPLTRSTLQLGYRFYVDNYGLLAHTAEVQAYQYLADWVYVRLSHRVHHQSGVDFFATDFTEMSGGGPRTSDSDLAPFTAQEVGLKLRVLGERSPFDAIARAVIDAAFYRYWRSNDLVVNWFGMSLGYRF